MGVVKTAGKMLKGQKPTVLLDKIGERLAFERTGSRLYEAIITKVMAQGGGNGVGPDVNLLRENQRQEMEHMDLLVDALTQMGADPTVLAVTRRVCPKRAEIAPSPTREVSDAAARSASRVPTTAAVMPRSSATSGR